MSRTPIDPSLIHDPDAEVAGQAAFALLGELVRPHLDPVVGARITSEIRNATFTEEEIRALTHAFGEAILAQGTSSLADLKRALKDARRRMRDPSSVPQEEIDEMVADACDEASMLLVSAWCNVLIIEGTQNGDLSLATLDDAMLPPLDEQMAGLFAQAVGQGNLTADDARAILRAVRAALPAGTTLPAAMVVILAQEDVPVSA